MPELIELKELYKLREFRIKSRLEEFSNVLNQSNEKIFEELCFCILTANSSAKSGIKSIENIKHFLIKGSQDQIKEGLVKSNYRFPNKRAEYIIKTRGGLIKDINFDLKSKISSFKNKEDIRDYFVKTVKGFGYKEASHFLRNIGLKGYCILDKHIVNTLHEFKIIDSPKTPKNKIQYIQLEDKMRDFSNFLNIDLDELDLLLWSRKTGEILK